MSPTLRPYLTYSFAAHAAALLAALLIFRPALKKASPVYHIDFVGPSSTVSRPGPAAPSAPAAAPAAPPRQSPTAEEDNFGTRRRRRGLPLPKPSLLRRFNPRAETEAPPETAPAAPAAPAAGQGAGAGGEAGVATDMPNFPYPWYISQVRTSLWSLWSARMPRQAGQAVVVFSVLPNGKLVDLRIEESSGDPAFDLTALGCARDAAPFAPLPREFSEPFLKIHVTLKSGG